MKELRGKTVLVAGMGKSGLAAAELLRAQGANVLATDERTLQNLPVPFVPQTDESFLRADLVVLSPGVPVNLPPVEAARSAGIPIIGEVELASYFLQGPVIGITGANGKTTTTAMIGHILKASGLPVQVGGNIGIAPTAMISSSRPDQWNVLELSSFQLETISQFHAKIAIATNVTPDHLDRHGTFENYARAKGRLFETQRPGDAAVLNADDPTCVSYAKLTTGEVHWFSVSRDLRNGTLLLKDAPLLEASGIPLRGLHNVENTLAAANACFIAGAGRDAIAAGIRSFPGVEHRLEFVREHNGVRFYNDSKATNVDATVKAIEAFDGGLWLILGGKDKNSDYTVLREKLEGKLRKLLLIGAAAAKIEIQLEGLPAEQSGTMEKAVDSAVSQAKPGDVVLLAPACASFDQFENFEHRGRVFKELVRGL